MRAQLQVLLVLLMAQMVQILCLGLLLQQVAAVVALMILVPVKLVVLAVVARKLPVSVAQGLLVKEIMVKQQQLILVLVVAVRVLLEQVFPMVVLVLHLPFQGQ